MSDPSGEVTPAAATTATTTATAATAATAAATTGGVGGGSAPGRLDAKAVGVSVAFVGNSYIYFNDQTRLFAALCESDHRRSLLRLETAPPPASADLRATTTSLSLITRTLLTTEAAEAAGTLTAAAAAGTPAGTPAEAVHVDCCLRCGVPLREVLEVGNGMQSKFRTPSARREDGTHDVGATTVAELMSSRSWDALVMNDYSQAPSRPASLAAGIATLQEKVAPLLNSELNAHCTAVFIVTPAYRAPAKGSEDLGTWREFTAKQSAGYLAYQKALASVLKGPNDGAGRVRLANLNAAFEIVHDENEDVWRELFFHDDYHPSSLGSFLEACCIFCAVFQRVPTIDDETLAAPFSLWSRARYMLPGGAVMRMPTRDEMKYLAEVAGRATLQLKPTTAGEPTATTVQR